MKKEIKKMIGNCPLCEEKSLHIVGEASTKIQQCINCGYVTSAKYKLNGKKKQEHGQWKNLSDEMKGWSTSKYDYLWLPTMMTLPLGMIYPINDKDGELRWAFAKIIDISEEDQKNYPIEEQEGKFHNKKIDTDNPKIFDLFVTVLSEMNNKMKTYHEDKDKPKPVEIKLPNLKKVK